MQYAKVAKINKKRGLLAANAAAKSKWTEDGELLKCKRVKVQQPLRAKRFRSREREVVKKGRDSPVQATETIIERGEENEDLTGLVESVKEQNKISTSSVKHFSNDSKYRNIYDPDGVSEAFNLGTNSLQPRPSTQGEVGRKRNKITGKSLRTKGEVMAYDNHIKTPKNNQFNLKVNMKQKQETISILKNKAKDTSNLNFSQIEAMSMRIDSGKKYGDEKD